MIVLITGASHTGKTALAQKLFDQCGIVLAAEKMTIVLNVPKMV